jgi:hypothetical protein
MALSEGTKISLKISNFDNLKYLCNYLTGFEKKNVDQIPLKVLLYHS